ncbi:hypothetical protein H3146_07785 [Streptomyces sp. OF3]|uniref:DUF8129 domain-containing protein n=2 Tax=Streptomyces alkaliterrae TaxID=2213162 RepID=A0A7W3WUU8_9ACTN|nr:hypothetical protein [Streptomyces alkaliterrae]MBB1253271.1 hypothetical protein [Streptomyces alkaliterrae]MBB1258934.1 hypothetical protein [Streptomyces alkaliterrae]
MATDLPLPDFDQLSPGDLEHRVRALDRGQLERLLAHERDHADRPAVRALLENRMRQLDEGAERSPGGDAEQPPSGQAPPAGSPVSPDTSPEPSHGPPHGSPHQMGRGDRMGP